MLDCTLKFSYTQYMYTLSDASRQTKKALKYLAIFIVALLILVFVVRGLLVIIAKLFPPAPPKPTLAFGKLPAITFPQDVTDANLTYSIDTLTGDLPPVSTQTKVYEIVKPQPDLLAVTKAQSMVSTAGFNSSSTEISDRVFEWADNPNGLGINRSIRMDTLNYSFNIYSKYASDSAVLSASNLPDQNQAVSLVKDTLSGMGLLGQDIDSSKTKTHLYALKNGSLTTSTSLSNTQIIQVILYQQDVNGLTIYYEKPNFSNISLLVASSIAGFGQIVGGTYIHQQISDNWGTYPLKTPQQAFAELKQGKAYIASYYGNSNKISIRNAFLAYYMSSQPQDFLMPIIVFQGDNDFFAYTSAVTDVYINK